jgi:hypothetical protein
MGFVTKGLCVIFIKQIMVVSRCLRFNEILVCQWRCGKPPPVWWVSTEVVSCMFHFSQRFLARVLFYRAGLTLLFGQIKHDMVQP